MTAPPSEYWKPLFRTSPFLDLIGPLFFIEDRGSFHIGMRVDEKHCNARGTVHGGVLSTLADISLGYVTAFSVDPPASLTTVNLSIDMAGSAKLGDWMVASVDIQKLGRRTAFANCYVSAGGERIARASGVFVRNDGTLN